MRGESEGREEVEGGVRRRPTRGESEGREEVEGGVRRRPMRGERKEAAHATHFQARQRAPSRHGCRGVR